MQRGVGFTLGLGARLIMDGKLKKTGLISPIDVPFDLVTRELEKHGIKITREGYIRQLSGYKWTGVYIIIHLLRVPNSR
jgi:hypothetical protein